MLLCSMLFSKNYNYSFVGVILMTYNRVLLLYYQHFALTTVLIALAWKNSTDISAHIGRFFHLWKVVEMLIVVVFTTSIGSITY